MTVTISLRDWKRINMEEVFERLEADMYEILGIAFGEDVKPDFDTDGPEQDYLIYDLIELVVNNKDSLTYKRILTKLRNEKLEEDFE